MLSTAIAIFSIAVYCAPPAAQASGALSAGQQNSDDDVRSRLAPVTLDGKVLFYLRGTTAYPAKERAKNISRNIKIFAADETAPVDSIRIAEDGIRTHIFASGFRIVTLFDEDGEVEGTTRQLLADLAAKKIAGAVRSYREDRTSHTLLLAAVYALGATFAAGVLLLVTLYLFRRLQKMAERRLTSRIEGLATKSGQSVHSEAIWMLIRGLLTALRAAAMLVIIYSYLNFTLVLFPWTRPLSKRIFAIVLDPLRTLVAGVIHALPGLVFIAILWIVTRYVLKILRFFFAGIASSRITISKFYPEWALATYRIISILIIAFAAVVSYPYIPGSGSGAFKGVSLFLGLVFSLGSSATIGNMIAGYSLTYRRAFKIGDRIRVNDIEGDVSESGVLVTHLRTIKNEDVIIPNSLILGSNIINFSKADEQRRLILHTTVGIGYETPWRQVEAMLVIAAGRTPGLLKDPPPFVLHKSLGDFAVTYELNVCTDDPHTIARQYSDLHRNILDVFNEYGVQIMTPAYVADTPQPKVVPRDQWFIQPAGNEKPSGGNGNPSRED
jgi:small-conductance mechanosensitive channel